MKRCNVVQIESVFHVPASKRPSPFIQSPRIAVGGTITFFPPLRFIGPESHRRPLSEPPRPLQPPFFGLMSSRMKSPATRSSSSRIIFLFVVFFWYPDAVLSSLAAPLTSVFMRSTL